MTVSLDHLICQSYDNLPSAKDNGTAKVNSKMTFENMIVKIYREIQSYLSVLTKFALTLKGSQFTPECILDRTIMYVSVCTC